MWKYSPGSLEHAPAPAPPHGLPGHMLRVMVHLVTCHVSRRLAAADCSCRHRTMPVCGDGARDAGNGHGRYVLLCGVFVRGGNG